MVMSKEKKQIKKKIFFGGEKQPKDGSQAMEHNVYHTCHLIKKVCFRPFVCFYSLKIINRSC